MAALEILLLACVLIFLVIFLVHMDRRYKAKSDETFVERQSPTLKGKSK